MNLNKSTSFVLLSLLNGNDTAQKIVADLSSVDIRSIQRALVRLTELNLVTRSSRTNPVYTANYPMLLHQQIPTKLLEVTERPASHYNHELIAWLLALSNTQLAALFDDFDRSFKTSGPTKMSAKELEYLTIELSWKSSSLEGNTYTLLDTQLLLLEGIKAKNRTEFETQMILNHKNTVTFIIENPKLFSGNITFSTVEKLHRIIGKNLGIEPGVRKKLVRISASNYEPLSTPHQLREGADDVLGILSHATNPYNRALLALTLVPYLQAFEDGNKRTGRMLANAILISSVGNGFSLRKTDAKQLALAYLSFYEFSSIKALSQILAAELRA